MSKVKELSKKYSNINSATFKKFVEADNTSTKKYLEYFLKMWSEKGNNNCPNVSSKLISVVENFDKLLPYIKNKDIYSQEYNNFNKLCEIVESAEIIKIDKTFDKNKNIKVLSETDDYLFLSPITFLGSLKYGAGTKWCTASKNNPDHFENYNKNGFLAYLIDKKNRKEKNYNKIALYCEYDEFDFNSSISIYNSADKGITESSLYLNGWTTDDFFEFFTIFRYTFYKQKKVIPVKREVDKFLKTIESLDFTKFQENLKKLELNIDSSYILDIQNKLIQFKEKTSSYYATRSTESESQRLSNNQV